DQRLGGARLPAVPLQRHHAARPRRRPTPLRFQCHQRVVGRALRFLKPLMAELARRHGAEADYLSRGRRGGVLGVPAGPVAGHLDLKPDECQFEEGNDLNETPYTTAVALTDGAVYDKLGLASTRGAPQT